MISWAGSNVNFFRLNIIIFLNREKLNKLQSALAPVKRDFMMMSEKEVLKVLQECKDAKVQQVLTGDYNLKLARQDYFTSNQDKVGQESQNISPVKRICVFEHSVMTNFSCACPAFRGARDLAFCLKVPLDSLLVWASSEGSGETARMRRLTWTFAARIGDKYQICLTRSIYHRLH